MLMTYMPYLMKHRDWIEKRFPMLLHLTPNWPIFQYLAFRQNAELRGLFGAPDLDRNALGEVMEYLTFDNINISAQIVADFKRWAQNKRVDTTDGFDLVAAWIDQQENTKTHIPTLHIIGTHDILVDPAEAKEEAKALGNDVLEVETGHAGAYYDKYLANEMADAIADKYNALVKCEELLARPRARRNGRR
jgi:pimeloyl-ACP methyl ester carboxylesterase